EERFGARLRRWGLALDGGAPAGAAARLGGLPGPVLEEVTAGLDAWMLERRRRAAAGWENLRRLADHLDRSAWRRRVRHLLAGDRLRHERAAAALTGGLLPWSALLPPAAGGRRRRLRELAGGVAPAREAVLSVITLARALAEAGDGEGAEGLVRSALAARPDQVVLLTALIALLEGRGRQARAEAIEYHRAARALRPHLGVGLARALQEAGRGAEARGGLRGLVREQPGQPEVHFHLGRAVYFQGGLVEAESAFRRAAALRPDYAEAHYNLGVALHDRRKLDEAEAALRTAAGLRPADPETHNGL